MEYLTDRTLGDRELAEFDALWEAHASKVWAYAARRVGRDRADDIVADVFVVLWRTWPLPEVRDVSTWMLAVARNHVRRVHVSDSRERELIKRVRSSRPDASEEDGSLDDSSVLDATLARFSPDDRELVRLLAWEQLTIQQAAMVLQISPAAARMRLSRLRVRVRRASGYFERLSETGVPNEA